MISKEFPTPNIKDWVFDVLEALDSQRVDMVFSLFMGHWCEQNNLVENDGVYNHLIMRAWALLLLIDFVRAVGRAKHPPTKWYCPPSGRFKVNVVRAS